jgi:phosphoribosylglycinamide formyltransferase-1
MTAPGSEEVERRRARVVELCAALPEAEVGEPAGRHVTFSVRGRTFGYYLDDHHGDGMVVVCVKAAPGEQKALVGADPDRFVVPDYLGNKGWVSLRIDGTDVDWDEVREMVVDSYRLVAPKRLAAQA